MGCKGQKWLLCCLALFCGKCSENVRTKTGQRQEQVGAGVARWLHCCWENIHKMKGQWQEQGWQNAHIMPAFGLHLACIWLSFCTAFATIRHRECYINVYILLLPSLWDAWRRSSICLSHPFSIHQEGLHYGTTRAAELLEHGETRQWVSLHFSFKGLWDWHESALSMLPGSI